MTKIANDIAYCVAIAALMNYYVTAALHLMKINNLQSRFNNICNCNCVCIGTWIEFLYHEICDLDTNM